MHQKQFLTRILFLLLAVGFVSWVARPAPVQASSPANVTLSSYTLTAQDNAVLIEWTTDTELGVFGFFLERGENGANFARLTNLGDNGIILAEGSALGGFDYAETDDTAVNGTTYSYRLYEIETNSNEILLAQKSVTLTGPTATPTPSATPTSTATPAPIGGTFAPPTSTPRPTSSTSTPTRQATSTPAAIGTSSPTAPAAGTATPGSESTSTAAAATNSPTPFPSATTSASASATPAIALTQPPESQPTPATSATSGPPTATATPMPPTPEIMPLPTFVTFTPSPTSPRPTPLNGNSVQAQGEDALSQAEPISDLPPTPDATAVSAAPDMQAEATPDNASRGRLLLWLGFLVALLIFAVSVVGSIIIFTRRQ